MALERLDRIPSPNDRRVSKTGTVLRLDKIGQLHEIFSYIAQKRGVSAEYFTDSRVSGGRAGLERSSALQELIEWNEEVPIGATDEEVASVVKRDRSTISQQRKRMRERKEKEMLKTTVRNALDKLIEEPVVTDLFVHEPTSG